MYDSDHKADQARRAFLGKLGLGAAALVLAPGLRLLELAAAKPDEQAVSTTVRWGLLIDTTRCASDCNACVTACNEEHGLQSSGRPEIDAQWIRKLDLRDPATGKVQSLPMLCQHCEHPPCVDVCPTGASFKRADGIVLVDKHICIGCRYCVMACPYQARSFIHEPLHDQKPHSPRGQGTVESCTFCVQRVDAGQNPACVDACQQNGGGAMEFGNLNDASSALAHRLQNEASSVVRADLGIQPGVRYQGI